MKGTHTTAQKTCCSCAIGMLQDNSQGARLIALSRATIAGLSVVFSPLAVGKTDMISLYHTDAVELEKTPSKAFSLSGELGLLASSGNAKGETYTGRLEGKKELVNWSIDAIIDFLYQRSEVDQDDSKRTKTTANRFFTSAQFNYKLLEPKHRLFIYAEHEQDQFNGFKYQTSLAAGWSEVVWDDDSSEFKYSVGPGYSLSESENDSDMFVNNGAIFFGALEFRYGLTADTVLRQFISTEIGSSNSKSKSETSLSSALFGDMAMKLSFIMNHNDGVTELNESLDTETRVTLVYSFF